MNREGRQDLAHRTKRFALNVIALYSHLSRTTVSQVLGKQVLRSATSVGAHYREACRAKSNADFVSKVEGALQELDETQYWLELLSESGTLNAEQVQPLLDETTQLISMFVTMAKNAKSRSAVI